MPLTCRDLDFWYRADAPVLRKVSLRLHPGQVVAVLGPNGSGKSTLLRLLLGALMPRAGTVELSGAPIRNIPARRRAAMLAYVPQRPDVAAAFTVREVVALGRYAAPPDDAAVERAIEQMDLADRADDLFAILSAGQQQRCAVARALAQLSPQPTAPPNSPENAAPPTRILLADEPISAMDPRHALATLDRLRAVAAPPNADGPENGSPPHRAVVVMVLHDITAALRYADRAVVLDQSGRVAADGPVNLALDPEILRHVFGVPFHRLSGRGRHGPIETLVPEA